MSAAAQSMVRPMAGEGSSTPQRSRSPELAGARCGSQQLLQRDGRVVPNIDPDIDLTRQRLEPPMAMTMQVQCAAMLTIPATERIVAQHEIAAAPLDLRIRLNTLPTMPRFW